MGKLSISEADDLLGACYRKEAMTLPKAMDFTFIFPMAWHSRAKRSHDSCMSVSDHHGFGSVFEQISPRPSIQSDF